MGDMRIHALSEKAFENGYKNLIATLMGALGITESPSQPAHEFIIYSLKHKFQMLSFAEIKLAFNLNAAGEFGEPIKAYQLLNMDFFGSVMAKYNERRQLVVLKTTPKALPEATISAEQRAENNKKLLQSICKDFEAYKVEPTKPILLVDLRYLELEERGLISITNEVKKQYFKKAKEIFKKNLIQKRGRARPLEIGATTELLQRVLKGDFQKTEKSELQSIAREIALKDYFQKWQAENFDLQAKLLK